MTEKVDEERRELEFEFYESLRKYWGRLTTDNKNSNRDHVDRIILISLFRQHGPEHAAMKLLEHFHPRSKRRIGTPGVWYPQIKTCWGENAFGATLLPALEGLKSTLRIIAMQRTIVVDNPDNLSLFFKMYSDFDGHKKFITETPTEILAYVTTIYDDFNESGCFSVAS